MPTYTLIQSKTGGVGSPMTTSPGITSITLDSAVVAGDLVFVISGANGGQYTPAQPTTGISDTLGTTYYAWYQSSNMSPGLYNNVITWMGRAPVSGACTITITYTWTGTYYIFPPYAASLGAFEYSGVRDDKWPYSYHVFDANGNMMSLNTGSTSGLDYGYPTDRDVIIISYAFNTGTAQMDFDTWEGPGIGVYSDTMASVGDPITAGPYTLPYFAQIFYIGEYVLPSPEPELGRKTRSMNYAFGD